MSSERAAPDADFDLEEHFYSVVEAMAQGIVIPVLGSAVNVCGRPRKNDKPVGWKEGKGNWPPTAEEIALRLLKEDDLEKQYLEHIKCPFTCEEVQDLPAGCPLKEGMTKISLDHLAEYMSLEDATHARLRRILRDEIIGSSYDPNEVHTFLAELPALLRQNGKVLPYPLIVTTCVDSVLEQAFEQQKQPFDLVAFVSAEEVSQFELTSYRLNDDKSKLEPTNPIKVPHSYTKNEDIPVILKPFGGVRSTTQTFTGATIPEVTVTEGQLLDYFSHLNIDQLLPQYLLSVLRERVHKLWFLEYSPSSWKLRMILHRIWAEQSIIPRKRKMWWVVQEYPEFLDQDFWTVKYSASAFTVPSLTGYIAKLKEKLSGLEQQSESKAVSDEPLVPTVRGKVFISYCHKDKMWLEQLQDTLAPLVEEIDIWDDKRIEVGSDWKREIQEAMESAKVAILLVSPSFLKSKFIAKEELPYLLDAAEKKGLKIFWIHVHDSLVHATHIFKYQGAHDIKVPLDQLESEGELHKVLAEIGKKLEAVIS